MKSTEEKNILDKAKEQLKELQEEIKPISDEIEERKQRIKEEEKEIENLKSAVAPLEQKQFKKQQHINYANNIIHNYYSRILEAGNKLKSDNENIGVDNELLDRILDFSVNYYKFLCKSIENIYKEDFKIDEYWGYEYSWSREIYLPYSKLDFMTDDIAMKELPELAKELSKLLDEQIESKSERKEIYIKVYELLKVITCSLIFTAATLILVILVDVTWGAICEPLRDPFHNCFFGLVKQYNDLFSVRRNEPECLVDLKCEMDIVQNIFKLK